MSVADRLLELSPLHDALSAGARTPGEEEAALASYAAQLATFPDAGRVAEFLMHPLRLVLKRETSSSRARELAARGLTTVLRATANCKCALGVAEELAQCLGDLGRGEEVRVAAVEA